ncbi:hypothetical protein F373_gp121 [Bacillus phage SP-10]|uniref:hypothetical protein n=1 Tax=Bacillus phage SP10 TaxID=941058 RepID=UPI0002198B4D|nr:hypothetical protein F373_gp121 [Bacillus phage SP-10]BAK52933.1 hypothetical protein [Bacillus phage SP-10]
MDYFKTYEGVVPDSVDVLRIDTRKIYVLADDKENFVTIQLVNNTKTYKTQLVVIKQDTIDTVSIPEPLFHELKMCAKTDPVEVYFTEYDLQPNIRVYAVSEPKTCNKQNKRSLVIEFNNAIDMAVFCPPEWLNETKRTESNLIALLSSASL